MTKNKKKGDRQGRPSIVVGDAAIDGKEIHTGDYIGIVGKEMLAVNESRFVTVCDSLDALNFSKYDFCILICGKDATDEEAQRIEGYIKSRYKNKELYIIDGGQDVYDYIMIVE
ncbi:MAG: hypothetical protein IKJ35_07465 [Clostridia bacterium]|nr:hypothetical protein [Clostridia bacterium]